MRKIEDLEIKNYYGACALCQRENPEDTIYITSDGIHFYHVPVCSGCFDSVKGYGEDSTFKRRFKYYKNASSVKTYWIRYQLGESAFREIKGLSLERANSLFNTMRNVRPFVRMGETGGCIVRDYCENPVSKDFNLRAYEDYEEARA